MPRLSHGAITTTQPTQSDGGESLSQDRIGLTPFMLPNARLTDLHDFDYMFPGLQDDPANLLPQDPQTHDWLIKLGKAMRDGSAASHDADDSAIPAAYTYLGQFIDHDTTLEQTSATLNVLFDRNLVPLTQEQARKSIKNVRTATLDLDSVYDCPALRDARNPQKMQVGHATEINGTAIPLLRPLNKAQPNPHAPGTNLPLEHDLPRQGRSPFIENDRAALIGDPRNDENLIVAQLHVAFLRAHNALVDRGNTFEQARRLLRQHYQHIVVHDFLKRIADKQIVDDIIKDGNRVYNPLGPAFFLPLEYSTAAYRFGHTMVRHTYDFNLNFNTSGTPAVPATLDLLFTFTAMSGNFTPLNTDTLPENWIIEWENLIHSGPQSNKARRLDTKLVEPLFHLRDFDGVELADEHKSLAARNLLRGYLLRMPTGQAVARELQRLLSGVRAIPVLSAEQLIAAAQDEKQATALRNGGFLERTPLWYYLLAEAALLANGQHLGPVGSTIVAEVLIALVRRSKDSILADQGWQPSLPSATPGDFTLADLLAFAGVLTR